MSLFGNKIDVKKPTKTTYSEDDIRNLELTYQKEFSIERGACVHSPIRKQIPKVLRTQIREYAFDKILEKGLYSFKHLLVVPNPYGGSLQTALLLFKTKESLTCHYQIFDDDGHVIFEANGAKTTDHKVPVILLCSAKTNKLNLELLNDAGEVVKRRPLTIYSREASDRMLDLFKGAVMDNSSIYRFLLINGMTFNPVVIDNELNIRYALRLRTTKTGMIPLANGHFLLPDQSSNTISGNGSRYCCNFFEIDYLGRVYRAFMFKYPFGKVFNSFGDHLFFLTSKDKGYENDWIISFNTETGEVEGEYSIAKLIGDKYRTCSNWIKITCIEVAEDRILIVLKNLHTIISVSRENFNINWVFGNAETWQGTPLEKYILKNENFKINDNDLNFIPAEDEIEQRLAENYKDIIRPVFAKV
nr:aryl-sulfate sulfotransferase [Lachnospiraceae bacterium]